MRTLALALFCLSLHGAISTAADPVPAPEVTLAPKIEWPKPISFETDPGRAIVLTAPTVPAGQAIHWKPGSEGDYQLIPAGGNCVFSTPIPGRYTVQVHCGGAITTCLVIVSGTPPKPIPPAPGPQPAPIADPLLEKLQKAYADDKDPGKAEWLEDLVAMYAIVQGFPEAWKLDADGKPTKERAIASTAELNAKVKEVGFRSLKPDQVVNMRKVIAAELLVAFPAGLVLTDATRKEATAKIKQIHDALAQVKP